MKGPLAASKICLRRNNKVSLVKKKMIVVLIHLYILCDMKVSRITILFGVSRGANFRDLNRGSKVSRI